MRVASPFINLNDGEGKVTSRRRMRRSSRSDNTSGSTTAAATSSLVVIKILVKFHSNNVKYQKKN
jgi:hypothetical protein